MAENDTHWRSRRTSEKWVLLKKKVSTTNLTKNIKNTQCITISLHIFKTYYRYRKLKPDMSIDSPKKVKIFLIWLLVHFLQYLKHITLICKKYSKFIEKLVEFINDLSINCSICSTLVFDWHLCLIQYKKNSFLFKKSLIPLSFLSKLYHETDWPRFDEYRHKKPFRNHLGFKTKLKVPRKTALGRFSKNTLTQT